MFCKKLQIHSEPLARMRYRCYLKKRMQWKFYVNIGQYECLSEIHMRLDFLVFQKKNEEQQQYYLYMPKVKVHERKILQVDRVCICVYWKKAKYFANKPSEFCYAFTQKKTCRFAMVWTA